MGTRQKAGRIHLSWWIVICAIVWLILFFWLSICQAVKNNVDYELGTRDADQQIIFFDPANPQHQQEKIFIGSDSKHFVVIQIQYDVELADIARYWLSDEPLADFNADEVVNFIDYAIWANLQAAQL